MVPARPLPIPVPLVQAETLDSYLSRLATANHLDPRDLPPLLGMRTHTRPPDLDRLSAMTGHPPGRLAWVLADAFPLPGRQRRAPLVGRIACRRCTASRGIAGDVWCVQPDQRVCRRHRRWLGGLTDSITDQHDLTRLPKVLRAQRRQYALLGRHGADGARTSVHSATTITDKWTEHGDWSEHRERRLARLSVNPVCPSPAASVLRMVNYPEVVTLAHLLASAQWRTIASADHRRDRVRFDREVAGRLGLATAGFDANDPLVWWHDAEALVRRGHLHQQPGYRGPEVWQAQPGELHDDLVADAVARR